MKFQFKAYFAKPLKLTSAVSQEAVVDYQKVVHHYLEKLCDMDMTIWRQVNRLLSNSDSYEPNEHRDTTVQAAQRLLENIRQSGTLPHYWINSLSDFLDEGKTNIFPFMHLKHNVRTVLEELCQVTELHNAVVSKHTDTDLFELHRAWGVSPMKTRSHIGFTYVNPIT